ncbi:hypothetical protein [Bacillus sp. ISL-7]|nr:hypothetical protein [Bacillus sp. ISL-7]
MNKYILIVSIILAFLFPAKSFAENSSILSVGGIIDSSNVGIEL